jgi:microcystin-dependent protein
MDPTLSEVRIFAGNFAPLSWAFCQGQLMSIAENTALFSLIGTVYGGDGQVTFALPDLRGRIAVGTGVGPGLPNWDLGEVTGSETVTLISTQLPAHTHSAIGTVTPFANTGTANQPNPGGGFNNTVLADSYSTPTNTVMGSTNFNVVLGTTGGSQPHENMMPYLALNFIIATEGIYPSRN